MYFSKHLVANEKGSVIATVVLILALVSMIGVASINRSHTEITTAGNEVVYKQNIYSAESAAVQNVFAIETGNDLELKDENSFSWLNKPGDMPNGDNFFDPDNWVDANSTVALEAGGRYLTVAEGVVSGGSMDMSVSQVYGFSIFGRCKRNSGLSVVRVGFRKPLGN